MHGSMLLGVKEVTTRRANTECEEVSKKRKMRRRMDEREERRMNNKGRRCKNVMWMK